GENVGHGRRAAGAVEIPRAAGSYGHGGGIGRSAPAGVGDEAADLEGSGASVDGDDGRRSAVGGGGSHAAAADPLRTDVEGAPSQGRDGGIEDLPEVGERADAGGGDGEGGRAVVAGRCAGGVGRDRRRHGAERARPEEGLVVVCRVVVAVAADVDVVGV